MEGVKEILTDIVQEKGVSTIILEYLYILPCKYCLFPYTPVHIHPNEN